MKTTKIFQTALAAGMVCFATFANAQNPSYTNTGKTTTQYVDNSVDEDQVDFVTIRAVMPYAIDTTQTNLADWLTAVSTAVGQPVTAATRVNWSLRKDGGSYTALSGASANRDSILMSWSTTEAAYTLKAETSIEVRVNGGSPINPLCSAKMKEKRVYVLPEPQFRFTDSPVVLSCDLVGTNQTVHFEATGIGERQVSYTITRKPYTTTAGSPEASVTPEVAGTVQTSSGFFEEGTTSYTTAVAAYDLASSPTWNGSITVDNLAVGFIYTVEITSLSDQVSRKSGVTVTLPTAKTYSFAVVPEALDITRIKHVKNF